MISVMIKALRNWGGNLGTIILNAKTGVMNFMKYLIQRRGKYSRRVSFIVLSLLLFIPFQNCSQGTFKIEEADSSSVSKSSVNEPSNTAETVRTPTNNPPGTIAPVAPTEPTAPTGPVGPSAAEIQAEIDRKNQCKAALQVPVLYDDGGIYSVAVISAKVFNLKSGLASGSGDVEDSSSVTVNVDANRGIKTSYDPKYACSFETTMQISLSTDPGKISLFNKGIDPSGALVAIADVNGQRVTDRLGKVLQIKNGNNNINNGREIYTQGTNSVTLKFANRMPQAGTTRDIRCADGVAYYKIFNRVSTTNLNATKVGYPASTSMANVSMDSPPVYVRVNVTDGCWKEQKLNNSIASIDSTKLPATNAKLGTSVAMDGDVAASLSEAEGGRGYIYLFRKSGVNWNFIQKVFAGNPNSTKLSRVALKGNLLAVSSSGDGLGYPGNVYLFDLSSGFAVASQTIKNPVTCSYPTTPCSRFGSSLALTGNSVIVGDMTAQVKGAAYLYVSNAGLYGVGGTSDRAPTATLLGSSLAGNAGFSNLEGLGANLVFQGNRAVVAAYNGNNAYRGSIHIFDVSGGTFASGVSINAPSSISDQGKFGYSVAFDGTSLAVGAVDSVDVTKLTDVARGALVYYKNYTNVSSPFIITGTNNEDRFGVSLAMVGDSIYVGARGNTSGGGFISRHTRANLDAGNNSRSFLQVSHDQETGESFSYSLSVSEGALVPTVIVGAQTKSQFVNATDIRANAGAVYIYEIQ